MKNVLIIGLLVISVLSLSYAYVEKSEVEEMNERLVELTNMAREQEVKAHEFQKMAEVAQQEAVVQRTICEEQLKAFKK